MYTIYLNFSYITVFLKIKVTDIAALSTMKMSCFVARWIDKQAKAAGKQNNFMIYSS